MRGLIEDHRHYTGSEVADNILNDFNRILPRFVKVLPNDYKKVLEKEKQKELEAKNNELNNFLKSIKEDPESDATNGEASKIKRGHVHSHAAKSEPKVLDLEDTIKDLELEKKAVAQIDKVKGFMKYKRRNEKYRPAKERAGDWNEMTSRLTKEELKYETARCMDCGVPFCTSDTGCPISNIIPKWNELVFKDKWFDALQRLMMTNNFPEFTGRICPAPCNGACVLGINEDPVNIKSVECAIIDHGFEQGWIKPNPPQHRTGKSVAIIGSGPAGLSAADQLNKAGHKVTVYERSDRPGGLMMYGIPNMKLDKRIVKRRTDLLEAEGIDFVCGTTVGEDVTIEELKSSHDAVVYAVGSTIPRDLKIPGRDLNNIDFAMKLLHSNTKLCWTTTWRPSGKPLLERMWLSLEVVTPVMTVWVRLPDMVPSPLPTSSCCQPHLMSDQRTTLGHNGHVSSEWTTVTLRLLPTTVRTQESTPFCPRSLLVTTKVT